MSSTPDPTDPWLRKTQTFPRLSEDMIARLSAYGSEETASERQLLFRRGDRDVDFFVVIEGEVRVYADHPMGARRHLFNYGAGQFTGEQILFTDRPALLSGECSAGTRFIRVLHRRFRAMLTGESDIGETIMLAFVLRRAGLLRHQSGGVLLIGHRDSAQLLGLERFLIRNLYPVEVLDATDRERAPAVLGALDIAEEDLPVAVTQDGEAIKGATNAVLADRLGLFEPPEADTVHDVAIVGSGPAGLAAAVYAASEGLKTVVIEAMAPGGQAGTSSRIENYLGFPTGISGQALAGRAHMQAQKFGARICVSRPVEALDCDTAPYGLALSDGRTIRAWSVVIATGARYRKLDLLEYDRFEGHGIHYAATALEADLCVQQPVFVVGGGNSAGQAAVFLAQSAQHVHVLVRGEIAATMSDYLVQRIRNAHHITLHEHSEVTALQGESRLERVGWIDRKAGAEYETPASHLFVMIGASPNTGWLKGCVALDRSGFVQTGAGFAPAEEASPHATSRAGIFAVGDVRSESVKRVASAVGEGAVVIAAVHRYLAGHRPLR